MFDLYTAMKFVHVISAVAWVGGGLMLDMLIAKAQRQGSQTELVALVGHTERFGKTFFTPTAILVLASGIVMASIGDTFAAPWVSAGFLAVFISAGISMAFVGPKSRQLRGLIETRGLNDPEVRALAGRLMLVSRINLAILTITVALMVFQPGSV